MAVVQHFKGRVHTSPSVRARPVTGNRPGGPLLRRGAGTTRPAPRRRKAGRAVHPAYGYSRGRPASQLVVVARSDPTCETITTPGSPSGVWRDCPAPRPGGRGSPDGLVAGRHPAAPLTSPIIGVVMVGMFARFVFDLAFAAALSVGVERLGAAVGRIRRGGDSDGGGGWWRWSPARPRRGPDRGRVSRARRQRSPRRGVRS